MVFFSEGLAIPPNVKSRFESVIDAANRANVSIYPMDAAGLRTLSTHQGDAGRCQRGQRRRRSDAIPRRDVTDRPMMMALEKNEDLLRADPHSGLGQLADQTGGFLIANTNDLRDGFARIDTDMRNYYVLTYVPKNTGLRRQVPHHRREGEAQRRCASRSRKGYFAVRAPSGAPVLGFEAPAMAVLDRPKLPNDFPVRALSLRFPDADRPGLAPVLVTVPTAGVAFKALPERKLLESDFIVLARIKDSSGTDDREDVAALSAAGPDRPAGQHQDAARCSSTASRCSARASTRSRRWSTTRWPTRPPCASRPSTSARPRPEALRVSSLVAVRRAEKVPEAQRVPGSPLYVGEQLLTPSMGEPFSKALTKELPFYFVVYPAKDGTPTATLSLLSAGKPLAEVPLELAAPDAKGRIPQVSRIPLDALQPGTYELRVAVKQGTQTAAQGLTFRLAP